MATAKKRQTQKRTNRVELAWSGPSAADIPAKMVELQLALVADGMRDAAEVIDVLGAIPFARDVPAGVHTRDTDDANKTRAAAAKALAVAAHEVLARQMKSKRAAGAPQKEIVREFYAFTAGRENLQPPSKWRLRWSEESQVPSTRDARLRIFGTHAEALAEAVKFTGVGSVPVVEKVIPAAESPLDVADAALRILGAILPRPEAANAVTAIDVLRRVRGDKTPESIFRAAAKLRGVDKTTIRNLNASATMKSVRLRAKKRAG